MLNKAGNKFSDLEPECNDIAFFENFYDAFSLDLPTLYEDFRCLISLILNVKPYFSKKCG